MGDCNWQYKVLLYFLCIPWYQWRLCWSQINDCIQVILEVLVVLADLGQCVHCSTAQCHVAVPELQNNSIVVTTIQNLYFQCWFWSFSLCTDAHIWYIQADRWCFHGNQMTDCIQEDLEDLVAPEVLGRHRCCIPSKCHPVPYGLHMQGVIWVATLQQRILSFISILI